MNPPADFSRNLGLISPRQQSQLHQARVAVCGVGGMGGVSAEVLVRMGVGHIVIVDCDVFSSTDINRQLHCTQHVIGEKKVEVIQRELLSINPDLIVDIEYVVDSQTVGAIVERCDIVVNGLDCLRSSILLEREARRRLRPIVDAWVTPYASVFVMTPDAPHWESFLSFPTLDKSFELITEADILECRRRSIEFTLAQFTPFEIISRELVDEILNGHRPTPSLVPVVWLSGTLMANEVMKLIIGQGKLASHWGVFYNHYEHELRCYDANRNKRDFSS